MILRFAAEPGPAYRPGTCNIGPAEIAARRRSGHAGVAVTLLLLATLVVLDADPLWRLALAIPAAGAAMGYLQAALRFCAGYGMRGIFNVGEALRDTTEVTDAEARSVDRRRSLELTGLALLIGVSVAGAAFLLPI